MEKMSLLKKIRLAAKMTQEQVAEAMDVSVNTVSNWERNMGCFKSKDTLHKLLDLYGADSVLRTRTVLEVFGRDGEELESDISAFVGSMDKKPTRIAVEDIYEKDEIGFPYPLHNVVSCLNAINSRYMALNAAIRYVEGMIENDTPMLFCRETAIIIDKVASEYGINVKAEGSFGIKTVNENMEIDFPFGHEDGRCYVPEFKEEMTYDEAFEKRVKQYDVREKSKIDDLVDALFQMEIEAEKLSIIRNSIMCAFFEIELYEGQVCKEYEIDEKNGLFWIVVNIKPTGLTYRMPANEAEISFALNNVKDKIIRRPGTDYRYVYCDSFCERPVAEQAISVMEKVTRFIGNTVPEYTFEEWRQICRNNKELQKFVSYQN